MTYHQILNQPLASARRDDSAAKPQPVADASMGPRGPPHGYPHLTTQELAARWRCSVFTISGNYRRLGLRPVKIGKRLLFPISQIEEAEARSMTK